MREDLIGLREAGKRSGIGQNYLRVLINRKSLAGVKIGRDWFVSERGLEDYLEKRRLKPAYQPKGPDLSGEERSIGAAASLPRIPASRAYRPTESLVFRTVTNQASYLNSRDPGGREESGGAETSSRRTKPSFVSPSDARLISWLVLTVLMVAALSGIEREFSVSDGSRHAQFGLRRPDFSWLKLTQIIGAPSEAVAGILKAYRPSLSTPHAPLRGESAGAQDLSNGIILFDRMSGEPYCLLAEGGSLTIRPGSCERMLPESEGQ